MPTLNRFLRRLLSPFRAARAEAELTREIDAHLRMLEDKFVSQGMSAEDARYAARREFGGVEQVKEHQRDARSFRSIEAWWLDVKLGARMLVKYPGLTLVGGLGMAVAIAVGATTFAFFYGSLHPTLPFDDGDRIVGLENWDTSWNNQEDRNLHDFVAWRDELRSVQDLSAYSMIKRNLIPPDGNAEDVTIAVMTASGFRVTRVPQLLGRPLVEDDERKGAPAVVVLGHDVWRRRFASDPRVIGQSVRIGSAVHTVVGVMPEGFAFPMNHHAWIPFQADPSDYGRRRGLHITMFGRLAPGATMDDANAELTIVGQRTAAAFPKTHGNLRPRVVRYTELWFDDEPRSSMHGVQGVVTMLVLVVGINVAILVFARTATRQGEIAVRSALGASRGRIVGQLFAEALVLSSAAAAVGLVFARLILQQANAAAKLFGAEIGGIPFWMTFQLSTGTVVYAGGLALVAAVVAGVLPALKATGRRVNTPLGQLGGGTGIQLGRMWTALVVGQVAFAVAVLPAAVFIASKSIRLAMAERGFAVEQFLVARLQMDWEHPATAGLESYAHEFNARYKDRFEELIRRVEAEPDVVDVTVTSKEPGTESAGRIEVDEGTGSASVHRVGRLHVAVDFFEAFGVPILTGRPFAREDVGHRRVVVSRAFVQQALGGSNPLGRRVRYMDPDASRTQPQPWYEIVGVAADFPASPIAIDSISPRVYFASPPGADYGALLAVRLRTADEDAFSARLRQITTSLDPTLRLIELKSLDEAYREQQMGWHWGAVALALVAMSVLMLSAAGIYALMSVVVTRRRKEIGIRVALGADRGRILRSLFQRAFVQLAIGVLLGLTAAALLDIAADGELMGRQGAVILPAVSLFMIAVGLLATLGPARRGLRINPIEALKAE